MAANELQGIVEAHSPFTVCAMDPKNATAGGMVLGKGTTGCRIVANGAVAAPRQHPTIAKMYR